MLDMFVYYLEHNVIFFLATSILLGIIFSIIIEKIAEYICSKNNKHNINTISEKHIWECICFENDNARNIDDVFKNLKNSNIDFNFSVDFEAKKWFKLY